MERSFQVVFIINIGKWPQEIDSIGQFILDIHPLHKLVENRYASNLYQIIISLNNVYRTIDHNVYMSDVMVTKLSFFTIL